MTDQVTRIAWRTGTQGQVRKPVRTGITDRSTPSCRPLTAKQQRFVDEYLVDLNATQAAVRAGYSARTARSLGAENLTKPDIQAAVSAAMRERERRTHIRQDRVLQELARLAFFDIRKLYDADGSLKRPDQLDADTAAALASIEVIEVARGDDVSATTKKVRLFDKAAALNMAMRHLGMFQNRVECDLVPITRIERVIIDPRPRDAEGLLMRPMSRNDEETSPVHSRVPKTAARSSR